MFKSPIFTVLDDIGGLAAIRLSGTLAAKLSERTGITNPMQLLRNAAAIADLIRQLTGTGIPANPAPTVAPEPSPTVAADPSPDDDAEHAPRNPTAHLYEFDQHRKPAQRKRENAAAMALLAQIDAGEIDGSALTDEQKAVLAKYSGTGGALIGADGKKGSAYEYYTPKPIAEGVWDLLASMGFSGGKVLDPCAGSGIFGATAPESAAVDAVELNETSGRVNALVNNGASYTTTISPFEKVAASTPDEAYDAVVTNVPFGKTDDRGGNQKGDPRYQKEPLENYFILRSLEKLKPGGLAAFITPPRCVTGRGGKPASLRKSASYMAEFLGAYRLPNSVFGTAAADTMTDVMVFRKYSRDVLDKIEELREQSPKTLTEANVLWPEFLAGKYFTGEGKRFILGEPGQQKDRHGKMIDMLTSPLSIAEIGKLMKRFPGSRVDWDKLDATETSSIIYREGDTLTQAGQTLQMKDGRWVPLKANDTSVEAIELLGKVANPYAAFENRVTWAQASGLVDFMKATSQALDIPDWLRAATTDINRLAQEDERGKCWNAGVVGLAAEQVLDEHLREESGFNYSAEYTALSDAMQQMALVAKSRPSGLGGSIKKALAVIATHYSKKAGFSAIWRGDVLASVAGSEITPDGTFEGLRYKTKSEWASLDDAKRIFGDSFDPMSEDWCLSADGQRVTRADDYYVGNYAEFLRRIDADIAAATDDAVRAKLLRQKLDADKRIDKIDVSSLSFNLFSPHVTAEEKAEFLRRFVHPAATVVFDETTGKKRVDIDIKSPTGREKLLNRIGDYMKNGTITLGGADVGMSDADALKELRRMVTTANEQFDGWVRSNGAIKMRLEAQAANPDKLRFRAVDDESPMAIAGMNPDLKLHGYQNAFVRQQAREFGGINGFDVGLGKTFSALAAVQYAQSIGVKKKTIFIVPNSVLSNWRREAEKAYVTTDDCLYVGLRVDKKGKAVVNSSAYDEDLTKIMENRHSKIFMTMEAFARLRLREETIANYQNFMRQADSSFAESENKKEDERAKGKVIASLVDILSEGFGNAPYLEDLGIDSIVADEAQAFKNSATTVDFKSAKFLSVAKASARGIDAQAKAWYIRGKTGRKDGVLLLTATPITNSPLEIYAMLSLAVGHERVNDMCLGIKGSDAFMEMMCDKVNEDDVTMDGVARTTDVFVGLKNVGVLRKAIGAVAVIKSAADVGEQIKIPDREEVATGVTLTPEIVERLKLYKEAFRWAIDDISEKNPNRGDPDAYQQVADFFGEGQELIAHPFNLINKMTMLIADPELDQRTSVYLYSPKDVDKAKAAVEQFNAKKFTEERPRPAPMTEESAIVGRKTVKNESGDKETILKIEVRAKIVDGKIIIDTIDGDTQTKFEAISDKLGLDLDVTVPPKLAAMLENYQREESTPRGMDDEGKPSSIVKQIVFCDILPMHNKIRRLLSKRAGVPMGAIAIITGKTNNKPEQIIAVQDGFNAHGEDNKYRAVIANEKGEVGINLQRGTQAMHHLTIGWTPDSLVQRNGRGARQGNKTQKFNIYFYDADGTFDMSKRAMVNKKADWISQVMDVNGAGSVAVSGGMSREQMEALIDASGDADAMRRIQDSVAAKEAESRASTNREKQLINADTIVKQREFLKQNPDATNFIVRKLVSLWKIGGQMTVLRGRIANPNASATAVARNENLLSELSAAYASLSAQIGESASISATSYSFGKSTTSALTPVEALATFNSQARKQDEKTLTECLLGRSYPAFSIEAIEGGQITNEWQFEVDSANGMIEEATQKFAKQAAEKGALPVSVIQGFADGNATIVMGKPLVVGMFIVSEAGLSVLSEPIKSQVAVYSDGPVDSETVVRLVKSAKLVYAGTSDYDECLTRAAQIEDAIANNGVVSTPFSGVVPEVAQRRKVETLAEYSIYSYSLPSPYFPNVVDDNKAQSSPLMAHIAKSQAAIIKKFNGSRFVVPSSLAVEPLQRSNNFKAMVDYARANGVKASLSDFGRAMGYAQPFIEETVTEAGLKAAMTGNTPDEVRQQAADYVKQSASWFDFGEDLALNPNTLSYPLMNVIQARINEFMPKPEEPAATGDTAQPPAPAPEATPTPVLTSDAVGIRGDTLNNKDKIKQAAAMAGKSWAKWDGRALQWNVLRSTWDYLVANYPQAAAQLKLCAPTRQP